MMLVQVDNINQFLNHPIDSYESPETLRNRYGDKIEGERIVIFDNNDKKYAWNYRNGKYIKE